MKDICIHDYKISDITTTFNSKTNEYIFSCKCYKCNKSTKFWKLPVTVNVLDFLSAFGR